ncbi:MAG: cation transporter [Chloroflexota bacterium]|jgi:Co/Zn/Cd efflux system component
MTNTPYDDRMIRIIRIVALANLAYFFVEFGVAQVIDSVSLFADSIDFLEDASVNGIILLALGWGVIWRRRVGLVLAGLLLVPGITTAWAAVQKFGNLSVVPEPMSLTLTGVGAMAVNFGCAWLLVRYRSHGSGLMKAAFLSARNDVLANIAIVIAGGLTFVTLSAWPDLIVGIGILVLNAGAAYEVWQEVQEME